MCQLLTANYLTLVHGLQVESMGIFANFRFPAQGQMISLRNKEKGLESVENQLSCNLISTVKHTLKYQSWLTDKLLEFSN